MGASIRNMFTFNKKSHRSQQKQKQQDKSRESSLSPSSSVASFSTMSTSGPQTPTTPCSEQDIRGIFRTLEPYWSFYHPQQHYWCHFDMDQTMALEQHYQGGRTKHMTLALHDESGSSCTVHFYQQQQQQQLKDGGLHFVMGKTLHRTVAPVWWFEQDLPDGSKGMCRFEHKNQVRLEALSEDRTRLSLVDSGLENASTTVIMTSNGQEEQQEEMRGLLYVHAHPPPMHSLDQKLQDIYSPSTINVATGPFDMAILQRRGSI